MVLKGGDKAPKVVGVAEAVALLGSSLFVSLVAIGPVVTEVRKRIDAFIQERT